MSSHVPNIPILGFTSPAVKPGAVSISARLGAGLYVLTASPDVWRELLSELADVVGIPTRPSLPNSTKHAAEKPAPATQAPDAVHPVPATRDPSGAVATLSLKRIDRAHRTEAYRALWHRYISDPVLTLAEVAEAAGVSQAAVGYRFRTFRDEPGAPALRSNGKL